MNEIRRSILWVIFGFSMILLWDQWQVYNGRSATFFPGMPHKTAASATGDKAAAGAAGSTAAKADASVPSAASATPAAKPDAAAVPGAAAAGGEAAARTLHTVSTDVMRLVFDAEGATLARVELLKHQANGAKATPPFVLLDRNAQHTYVAQSGLIGGTLPTHKTPMTLAAGPTALADGQDQLTLRFESAPVGDVVLAKTYTLQRGRYDIGVRHEVINRGGAAVTPQLYLQLVRDGSKGSNETPFYSTFTGPAVYSPEAKFQKVEFADIDKGKVTVQASSSDGYVAMVQHYFASAWLPASGSARENFVRKVDGNLYSAGSIVSLGSVAPGQTLANDARLYVGPQEEKVLEKLTPGLELVKDYGWLTILAKPLYWLLEKIHAFVGNWGWAIVLLVVLLKAAFYWLNASAYRSMAKMKAINPRIMEMRERLKDNPQQMQQEMMKIYRDEKVNPLGGCFPIMIQIPVFIALYWVLLATVEMRNAPWMGWIHDLATPDPYYILPLVMTVTTVIQTALNPLPPDPMQAKLMWFMPLVFSVMFFFFPSGLVLYWITNNVLTIAQQAFINHRMGVPLKFNLPKFS